MKKFLTLAVTSAVVLGTSQSALAAANPFSDVPQGHWSYDAVSELVKDGIIEGYGDGTFRGDRAITRYEMAQIVAKAMAKEVNGDAKASLDKLAAEYADELNNLGVRINKLEDKVDNVKFDGYLRMRYLENKYEDSDTSKRYPSRFRLNLKAKVNEDWNVRMRTETNYQLDNGTDTEFTVKAAYAQGKLFGTDTKIGRFPQFSADNGMILDAYATGIQVIKQHNRLTSTMTAGIIDKDSYVGHNEADVNYQGHEYTYDVNDKLDVLAAYHHFGTSGTNNERYGYDNNHIWEIGLGYNFNDNLKLSGAYAKSSVDSVMADGGKHRDSYTVDLMYKGAKLQDEGSFGAYLAYRNLTDKVSIAPTYATADRNNLKGWEIGTAYTIAPNITATVQYFDGKEIGQANNRDYRKFMGELKFYF